MVVDAAREVEPLMFEVLARTCLGRLVVLGRNVHSELGVDDRRVKNLKA